MKDPKFPPCLDNLMVLLLFKVSLNKALLVELNGSICRSLDKGKKGIDAIETNFETTSHHNETKQDHQPIDTVTIMPFGVCH